MAISFNTVNFITNDNTGPVVSGVYPSGGTLGTSFYLSGQRLDEVTDLYLLHQNYSINKEITNLTPSEILSSNSTGIYFEKDTIPSPVSIHPDNSQTILRAKIPLDFPRIPQEVLFRAVSKDPNNTIRDEWVTGKFITWIDDFHVNKSLYLHSGEDFESRLYTISNGDFGLVALNSPGQTGIILTSFAMPGTAGTSGSSGT